MPNWCYNTLTIQGPKSEIDMIKDRLNAPFTISVENFGMGDISANGFPMRIKEVTYSAKKDAMSLYFCGHHKNSQGESLVDWAHEMVQLLNYEKETAE